MGCNRCGLCCHYQTGVSLSEEEKKFYEKYKLRLPLIRKIGNELLESLREKRKILEKYACTSELIEVLDTLPEDFSLEQETKEIIQEIFRLSYDLLTSIKTKTDIGDEDKNLEDCYNKIMLQAYGLLSLLEKKDIIQKMRYKKIEVINGMCYYNDKEGRHYIPGIRVNNKEGFFYLTQNYFERFVDLMRDLEAKKYFTNDRIFKDLDKMLGGLIVYLSMNKNFNTESANFDGHEILERMKILKTNEEKYEFVFSEIKKIIHCSPLYLLDYCEFYVPGYGCMVHNIKKPRVCEDYSCEKCK